MEDDIVRQAALRRQRRARCDVDDIFNETRSKSSKDTESPNKLASEGDQNSAHPGRGVRPDADNQLSLPRIHNFRRRPFADRPVSYNNQTSMCLPFINIKVLKAPGKTVNCHLELDEMTEESCCTACGYLRNYILSLYETDAKALINSCVMTSIINRHLYQNVFACDVTTGQPGVDKAREIPLTIGGKVFHFDLLIRGDIPDLVLGLDFLTLNKCSVDFGNKTFTARGDNDVTVKLISDRDLPLRYRHSSNLVASV